MPNALVVFLWLGAAVVHLYTGWDHEKYLTIHYRWVCYVLSTQEVQFACLKICDETKPF